MNIGLFNSYYNNILEDEFHIDFSISLIDVGALAFKQKEKQPKYKKFLPITYLKRYISKKKYKIFYVYSIKLILFCNKIMKNSKNLCLYVLILCLF